MKLTSKSKVSGGICITLSVLQLHYASFVEPFNTRVRLRLMTIDKSGANTAALTTLNADKQEDERITIRQRKYLKNLAEQVHCNIKCRIRQMLEFSSFRRAQTHQDGIELLHMIRKWKCQHMQSEGLSHRNNSIFKLPK